MKSEKVLTSHKISHFASERQTFRASTYASDMVAGFRSLRENRSLCDCVLVAQGITDNPHSSFSVFLISFIGATVANPKSYLA